MASRGYSLLVVCGLLVAVASFVVEPRLSCAWASVIAARGLRCLVACGIFPDTGIEPVSPALAGQFLTTGPSGKSRSFSSEWGKSLDALPSPFSLRCPVCRGTAETEAVMDPFTLRRRKRSDGTFHSGSGYCTSFPHNGQLTACISEHVF